jgi:hypothetical protein
MTPVPAAGPSRPGNCSNADSSPVATTLSKIDWMSESVAFAATGSRNMKCGSSSRLRTRIVPSAGRCVVTKRCPGAKVTIADAAYAVGAMGPRTSSRLAAGIASRADPVVSSR